MLEGLQPPNRLPACKVRTILESLEPKDQEILIKAIADSEWPTVTLAEQLTKRGLIISESPLRKHRAKRCSCNA
jgi:hypothetical protein